MVAVSVLLHNVGWVRNKSKRGMVSYNTDAQDCLNEQIYWDLPLGGHNSARASHTFCLLLQLC